MNHKTILNATEKENLVAAIRKAEDHTIGEIKVHIDNTCSGDVLDKAAYIFKNLSMHETKARTGVLIYVACKDRKMAILGDVAINHIVAPDFWQSTVDECIQLFKEEKYFLGLSSTVEKVGKVLHTHFPATTAHNENEISNDLSFGDEV
jgi:uncharacterized membrane protein